jgi:hypothetical protein
MPVPLLLWTTDTPLHPLSLRTCLRDAHPISIPHRIFSVWHGRVFITFSVQPRPSSLQHMPWESALLSGDGGRTIGISLRERRGRALKGKVGFKTFPTVLLEYIISFRKRRKETEDFRDPIYPLNFARNVLISFGSTITCVT